MISHGIRGKGKNKAGSEPQRGMGSELRDWREMGSGVMPCFETGGQNFHVEEIAPGRGGGLAKAVRRYLGRRTEEMRYGTIK